MEEDKSGPRRRWVKKEIDRQTVGIMAKKFRCKPLVASILARRGIVEGEDALFFLEDDLRFLHSPFLFKDMEKAVDRVLRALDEGEKVLVFGDRDVDGVTGSALLYNALKELGLDVTARVPVGDEPYGLTMEAVDAHEQAFGSLIITVDCGISCAKEIAHANELGVDVVVLDHHTPPDVLPEAAAIINPHMEGSGYPFKNLCGCAVAWKFITALRFGMTEMYKQSVCLLNARPLNDAFCVEVIKTANLTERERVSETLVPGMVDFQHTRLPAILEGQHIFVWDGAMQKRQLELIFGSGIEFNFLDVSEEIAAEIPSLDGMSLLKLKDYSKIARYTEKPASEIDGFFNIFVTYMQKKIAAFSEREERELQLVALGTIADIMPLKNENRILARRGVASVNRAPATGIFELLSLQNLAGKELTAHDLSWKVTPVLNAAGRMGNPEKALRLLQADTTQEERQKLAAEIVAMNEKRRELEKETWAAAEPMAYENFKRNFERIAFAAGTEINRGITGLTASRMARHFGAVSVAVSVREDGTAVGSMRSVGGVNLKAILEICSDLFSDYGGHAFAAGFTLKEGCLAAFEERIHKVAEDLEPAEENLDEIAIDAELPHECVTPELLDIADLFEPYGEGNVPLEFLVRGARIIDAAIIGKAGQHVKLTLDCGKFKWPALYWNAAELCGRDFAVKDRVDAVFRVSRNFFNGAVTPQMIITDLRRSSEGLKDEKVLAQAEVAGGGRLSE